MPRRIQKFMSTTDEEAQRNGRQGGITDTVELLLRCKKYEEEVLRLKHALQDANLMVNSLLEDSAPNTNITTELDSTNHTDMLVRIAELESLTNAQNAALRVAAAESVAASSDTSRASRNRDNALLVIREGAERAYVQLNELLSECMEAAADPANPDQHPKSNILSLLLKKIAQEESYTEVLQRYKVLASKNSALLSSNTAMALEIQTFNKLLGKVATDPAIDKQEHANMVQKIAELTCIVESLKTENTALRKELDISSIKTETVRSEMESFIVLKRDCLKSIAKVEKVYNYYLFNDCGMERDNEAREDAYENDDEGEKVFSGEVLTSKSINEAVTEVISGVLDALNGITDRLDSIHLALTASTEPVDLQPELCKKQRAWDIAHILRQNKEFRKKCYNLQKEMQVLRDEYSYYKARQEDIATSNNELISELRQELALQNQTKKAGDTLSLEEILQQQEGHLKNGTSINILDSQSEKAPLLSLSVSGDTVTMDLYTLRCILAKMKKKDDMIREVTKILVPIQDLHNYERLKQAILQLKDSLPNGGESIHQDTLSILEHVCDGEYAELPGFIGNMIDLVAGFPAFLEKYVPVIKEEKADTLESVIEGKNTDIDERVAQQPNQNTLPSISECNANVELTAAVDSGKQEEPQLQTQEQAQTSQAQEPLQQSQPKPQPQLQSQQSQQPKKKQFTNDRGKSAQRNRPEQIVVTIPLDNARNQNKKGSDSIQSSNVSSSMKDNFSSFMDDLGSDSPRSQRCSEQNDEDNVW